MPYLPKRNQRTLKKNGVLIVNNIKEWNYAVVLVAVLMNALVSAPVIVVNVFGTIMINVSIWSTTLNQQCKQNSYPKSWCQN